ncbi:CPBP family intramembrane glutamic endopeptidase [Haloimpatiens sp. FM7315]|uniref:CPBP family intramembrane glutamic endopeptidase n=1 Tax=Haloimpatiens sp. FM7315 TaxID=3298609 RepID=UPI00370CC74C
MELNIFKKTKIRYLFIKIFCVMVLGILGLVIYSKGFKKDVNSYDIELLAVIISSLWLILVCSFLKKNNINIEEFIGRPSRKTFVFEVPLSFLVTYIGGIGCILAMLYVFYKINPEISSIFNSELIKKETLEYSSMSIIILSFIGSVVIAPITEELIFRGVLLRRLYSKYGINKSIIYSSLIFFIMHLRPNPILLFLGISLGILTYKYKSLIPSITLHMLNNIIVFISDANRLSANGANNDLNINLGFLIIGGAVFLIYIFYIYKNFRNIKHSLLNIKMTGENLHG